MMCSKFIPATIYKRAPVTNDPEAKVLLDDTDNEDNFVPPVAAFKKKMAGSSKKGKSNFDTEENISFFSDDIESHQFMQKYKKKGGWTY